MAEDKPYFLKPGAFERIANGLFGLMVGLGLGFSHNYNLEVRGRKTGRVYSAPVNLLEYEGKRYLVAPRGETGWVRNARVVGEVSLVKSGARESFSVREVPVAERPALLKEYLDRFAGTVQRYFPIQKNSPADSFSGIAERYPVFELTPKQ